MPSGSDAVMGPERADLLEVPVEAIVAGWHIARLGPDDVRLVVADGSADWVALASDATVLAAPAGDFGARRLQELLGAC
jgi:hypothetical protein